MLDGADMGRRERPARGFGEAETIAATTLGDSEAPQRLPRGSLFPLRLSSPPKSCRLLPTGRRATPPEIQAIPRAVLVFKLCGGVGSPRPGLFYTLKNCPEPCRHGGALAW